MGVRDRVLAKARRHDHRKRERVPPAILAALDIEAPPDDSPTWPLHVAEATACDIGEWQASRVQTTFDRSGKSVNKLNLRNIKARLLVRCLVNDTWGYEFEDGDEAVLGEFGATVIDPLYELALKLNGLSADDDGKLAGKLDPNGSAPTASPSPSANGTSTA